MEEDDEKIPRMRDRIVEAEAALEILKAVTSGYESLRNAASREMSRRGSERAATD